MKSSALLNKSPQKSSTFNSEPNEFPSFSSSEKISDQKLSPISVKSPKESVTAAAAAVIDEISLDDCIGEHEYSDHLSINSDESLLCFLVSGSGSGFDFPLSAFFFFFFFKWVCHMFLISLSVRPGNLAAITDHLHTGRRKIRLKIYQSAKLKTELFKKETYLFPKSRCN